jgi:hypothetical protein
MTSLPPNPGISSRKTTRLVADLASFQNFRKWIHISSKHHGYEDICSSLLSYLDSFHICCKEDNIICLENLIMELKLEQEIQRMSQDSSPFEELSDQQQEQYELKTDEMSPINSEQYKAGYQAANMAEFYRYYDLRPKVSTLRFILPIENEFSASKQPSCQNTSPVQNPFYDIDIVNSHKEPFKEDFVVGHNEVVVIHALKDPFFFLLKSSIEMSYVMFKHEDSFKW